MTPVFRAARQGVKVRLLTWFSLVLLVGALWWGYDLYQNYGLAPGDGGVLRPLPERLAWGGGVAGLGLLFAGSMVFYESLYIDSMGLEAGEQTAQINTLHPFGHFTLRIPVQDIHAGPLHLGQMDTGELTVNAPWHAIHIQGRRLALILDLQGEILNVDCLKKIIKVKVQRRG